MTAQTVGHVRRALYTMLGGVFFLFVDLNIVGLDLLHDAIGALLLAAGASRLAAVRINPTYDRQMPFAVFGAIILVLERLIDQLDGPGAPPPFLLMSLASLLIALALGAFCLALGWLWTALGDPRLARLWRGLGWAQLAFAVGMALVRIGGFLPGVLPSELPNSPSTLTPALLQAGLIICQALLVARSYRLLGQMDAGATVPSLADQAPRRRGRRRAADRPRRLPAAPPAAPGQGVGHAKAVTSLDWHPGGRWLLTNSEDGTGRIWDIPPRCA